MLDEKEEKTANGSSESTEVFNVSESERHGDRPTKAVMTQMANQLIIGAASSFAAQETFALRGDFGNNLAVPLLAMLATQNTTNATRNICAAAIDSAAERQ